MIKWFNEMIELGYKVVDPMVFYKDIFKDTLQETGVFGDHKYCGIAVEIVYDEDSDKRHKILRHTITKDLKKLEELLLSENFVLLSPISYVGKSRSTDNARVMYAFALEIDNILYDEETGDYCGLKDLLHQMSKDILPQANYLVTSGNGVHLYFILDKPLRLFNNVKASLTRYKKFITRQFWNRYITFDHEESRIQYESAFQGFRLAGGVSKSGERTSVFKLSDTPVSIDYLNKFVYQLKGVKDPSILVTYESKLTLEEAKKKYPEWYEKRIVNKQPKGTWVCKRALYDWWLRRIGNEIKVGHRYHALMILSIYAIKCNIPYDELLNDCMSLLKPYDDMSITDKNRFTLNDVMDALQAYEDKGYITYPINSIRKLSGLEITKNKRNYRKQKDHIVLMHMMKKLKKELGEEVKEGRPDKKEIVAKWRFRNPNGRKCDCIRETGLSEPTVYKWWNYKE